MRNCIDEDNQGSGFATDLKSRTRLLVVSNKHPAPPSTGHRERLFHLISELARHYEVTLLVISAQQPRPAAVMPANIATLLTITPPRSARWHWHAWSWLLGRTALSVIKNRELTSNLAHGLPHLGTFDAVFVTGSIIAEIAAPLLKNRKIILDLPHLEKEAVADEVAVIGRSRAGRDFPAGEAVRCRRLIRLRLDARGRKSIERKWVSTAALVTCTTQAHARALAEIAARVVVVPNGVTVVPLPTRIRSERKPPRVLMLGNQGYPPNADAVRWACDEILPSLRRARPEIEFELIGDTPSELADYATRSGIHVRGFVPDLRPFLDEATAMLVPLRAGSGSKTKVLQAMSAGLPVVSTTCGAEGLDVRRGVHLLVADTAAGLVDAALLLLRDAELQHRLAFAAHALVAGRYNWNTITYRAFHDAWRHVLDNATGQHPTWGKNR